MRLTIGLLMLCPFFSFAPRVVDAAPVVEWIRQFGAPGVSYSGGGDIAADQHGNFYVVGSIYGTLSSTNVGGIDVYVNKYDATGQLDWDRLFGTPVDEGESGISTDVDGNLYVGGTTGGDLGAANAGGGDAYLRKYNPAGDVLWTRQLGTARIDIGYGVDADALGNVYLTGGTQGALGAPNQNFLTDPFVQRYDSTGTPGWTRQWGTAEREWAIAAETDGDGNIFVLRLTQNESGVPSAYELRKLNPAGDLLWSHPFAFGYYDVSSKNLSTDSHGNIFIGGRADFGRSGIFAKLDGEGQVLWSENLSTRAISVDGDGNVYASRGMEITKYSGSGAVRWTHRFADDAFGTIDHLSADGLGNVFVSGTTTTGLGGPLVGTSDVWLALVRDVVPEPNAALLTTFAALALLPATRRARRACAFVLR